MAKKTKLWRQLPWIGGVNTTLDPAVVPQNQLTKAENILLGVNGSKKKRPGIDKNWDDVTSATESIIGSHDFWFLSGGSKIQREISLADDGVLRSYNSGTATSITVDGVAYSSPTIASMRTMNSNIIIATDGTTNRIKKYSGSGNADDLLNTYGHTSISRASSGTTRTLVMDTSFKGVNGDIVHIQGGPSDYNGSFTVTSVTTTTVTDDTIQYTGSGSLTEGTTGDTSMTIDGLAPNGDILGLHQGRLLTNDKTKPYRLHYSEVGKHEVWGGYGDSGAIDIQVGDDDPEGITAIFPTFQGDLFVAKKTKLYRISGLIPNHRIDLVSSNIGCISNEAVTAFGQSDVVFVSERGIHSLITTAKFGDFEDKFLSRDIQKTFNEDFTQNRKKFIKAASLDVENIIAFAVSQGSSTNNTLWMLSFIETPQGTVRAWYSWPDINCESIHTANDSDRKRLYIGSTTTRLYQTFTTDRSDTSEAGVSTAIAMRIESAQIHPEQRPIFENGFKKVSLYYTPKANPVILGEFKVDGFGVQAVAFDQTGGGTPLGTGFTLGSTELGSTGLFAPYARTIDGYGRGIQLILTESGINTEFSIEGISIEYQSAGTPQDVNQGE